MIEIDPTAVRRALSSPLRRPAARSTSPRALQTRLGDRIRYRREDLVDIMSRLGARLEEQQTLLVRVRLCLGRADLLRRPFFRIVRTTLFLAPIIARLVLLTQIELVPHQCDHNPGTRLPLQLGHPVFRFHEAARLRDVVDDQRGLGIAVVHGRQAGEALLARRVPDFEFDGAGGELAFLGEEGGADGGFFVGLEVVVDETEDEGGLMGRLSDGCLGTMGLGIEGTFPTAASPSSTSLTLLLGLGAEVVESPMEGEDGRFARSERPTLYVDSLVAGAARSRARGMYDSY